MTEPKTTFDWPMYADATLAGLSLLVPIPLMDLAAESFFRKRIPRAVAKARGVTLDPEIERVLSTGGSFWSGCLSMPIVAVLWLLKAISRKLLYFLTIREATQQLGHYWHRAFLIDYMLLSGHLADPGSAAVARQAMDQVLEGASNPMKQVARQVILQARHVGQTIKRARRGQEDETVDEARSAMAAHWAEFSEYLKGVAVRYDEAYSRLMTAAPPPGHA